MGNTTSTRRARVHKELERFVKPTGLYTTCAWDERSIRKLILDGKIAPRFVGFEAKYQGTDECPICFMRYCAVNYTSCCKKPICSECYLQVRSPRGSSPCPYCNHVKLQPSYGVDDEDKMMEKELAVIALHDKISESEEKRVSLVPVMKTTGDDGIDVASADEVYANAPLATVDDRRNIEAEVRKQFELERSSQGAEAAGDMRPVRGSMMLRWTEGRRLAGGGGGGHHHHHHHHHQRRGSDPADVRRAFLHTLGMPRDLQHVEELMLMEAIRQSMEEQARVAAAGAGGGGEQTGAQVQQQQPGAGTGQVGARGGSESVDEDTKEERPNTQRDGSLAGSDRQHGSRLVERGSMGEEDDQLWLALNLSMEMSSEEAKQEGGGGERGRRSSSLSSSSSSSSSTRSVGRGGSQMGVLTDGSNLISSVRLGTPAGAGALLSAQQQHGGGEEEGQRSGSRGR